MSTETGSMQEAGIAFVGNTELQASGLVVLDPAVLYMFRIPPEPSPRAESQFVRPSNASATKGSEIPPPNVDPDEKSPVRSWGNGTLTISPDCPWRMRRPS